MKFHKKGQFMIFAGVFLFSLLYFIYSIETDNTYILKNGDFLLLENYEFEVCNSVNNKTGTSLNTSLNITQELFVDYCNFYQYNCQINYYNITESPPAGNFTLFNLSQLRFNLTMNFTEFTYTSDFSC